MVALAVPRLGYTPKLCLARPMLYAALDCYERGDLIGAGVRLREAVLRFVVAMADWHGIEVKTKDKHPRPGAYITALHKAGKFDKFGRECLFEMVNAGNKLAHCLAVDAGTIRGGISILFAFMDGEAFCPHERKPIDTSYKVEGYEANDCDDDDSADWWKGGAV